MASKLQDNPQGLNIKVLVKDGVVQVPLNLLKKSDVLSEMFNLIEDKSEFIKLPIFEIKDIKLLLKCWKDQSVHSSLKLKSIIKIVRIADYLNEMELMESIALNAILPLIHGLNAAEIRIKFSIKPVKIKYNEEDWSLDPIAELDERNYLMDIMPLKIVLSISNALPIQRSICFVLSFGSKHRYFNILQSAFNEKLTKANRADDSFHQIKTNLPYNNWYLN